MKQQIKIASLLVPILLVILASNVSASEGRIDFTNKEGGRTDCFALSGLMPSYKYQILMLCQELIYPASADQFNYVAWTQPTDGSSPVRLGSLGVGKVEFSTTKAFSSIFVTRESSGSPRNPSQSRILEGSVSAVPFTANPTQPQPDTENPQQTATPTISPIAEKSLLARIFTLGNIIPFVGVVLLLILVFILTRR